MPLRRRRYGLRRAQRVKRRALGRFRRRFKGPSRLAQRKIHRAQRMSSLILRQPTAIPDRMFVKLKTHFDLNYTNTGGGYVSAILQMNSAFDPMGTSGANQGYMFDQFATLYQNYRVHGMSFRCEPTLGATGISATSVRELIVVPSLQGTAFSSAQLAIEQPRSRSHRWQVNSGRAPSIRGFFAMPALLGFAKHTYRSDSATAATISANPAQIVYLHIATYDPVLTANVDTNVGIWVTQYVEFFTRAIPGLS